MKQECFKHKTASKSISQSQLPTRLTPYPPPSTILPPTTAVPPGGGSERCRVLHCTICPTLGSRYYENWLRLVRLTQLSGCTAAGWCTVCPAPGWSQAGLDTCTAAGLAPQLRREDRAAAILLLGDKMVHEICYNIVIKSHEVSEVSF